MSKELKVTATYKTNTQVGPDDWDVFTQVVHLKQGMTLEEAYDAIERKKGMSRGMQVNVEMQFMEA